MKVQTMSQKFPSDNARETSGYLKISEGYNRKGGQNTSFTISKRPPPPPPMKPASRHPTTKKP
jgi:hypothetical protein